MGPHRRDPATGAVRRYPHHGTSCPPILANVHDIAKDLDAASRQRLSERLLRLKTGGLKLNAQNVLDNSTVRLRSYFGVLKSRPGFEFPLRWRDST